MSSVAREIDKTFKLDGAQIEAIVDRLVPLIAAPEDHGFFRGLLFIYAEEVSSGHFAHFVNTLLKSAASNNVAPLPVNHFLSEMLAK